MINKNTYYMLSPEVLNGAVSISRATSGKYKLTKNDAKIGYYFIIKEQGINLRVPFRALFSTNDKLKGIKSISFSTAKYCQSYLLGLCQLKEGCLSCYAKNGEARASGTRTKSGHLKLNSFLASCLVIKCLNQLKTNSQLLQLFIEYVSNNIKLVRFNLKGDFKNSSDIILLSKIVSGCTGTVFYGYSARDDLLKGAGLFELFSGCSNFYLNGSNCIYTNRFKATYDLKEWFLSSFKCLGGCTGCKKCFKLHDKTINCLIHNKSSDKLLNTADNRAFLADLLNCYGLDITAADLTARVGLLDSFNNWLTSQKIDLQFNKFLDFYYYVTDTYEINDNIELLNIEDLKEYGAV